MGPLPNGRTENGLFHPLFFSKWLITMVIVSPLSRVVPLPNGLCIPSFSANNPPVLLRGFQMAPALDVPPQQFLIARLVGDAVGEWPDCLLRRFGRRRKFDGNKMITQEANKTSQRTHISHNMSSKRSK